MLYLALVLLVLSLILYRNERKVCQGKSRDLRARLDRAGTSRALLDAEWQANYREVKISLDTSRAEVLRLTGEAARREDVIALFRTDRESFLRDAHLASTTIKALERKLSRVSSKRKPLK